MDDKLLNCTLIVIAIFCIYILFKEDIENMKLKPSWMNNPRLNLPIPTKWGDAPILSSSSIPQSSLTQSVGTMGYNANSGTIVPRYVAPRHRTKTKTYSNIPDTYGSTDSDTSSTQSVGTMGYNASDVVQAGRYAAPSWRTKTRKAKTNTYGDYDQGTDSSQFDQLLQGAGTGVASGNALGSSGSDWSARLKKRSQKYDKFEDPVQSQGFIDGEYRDDREY